MYIFTDENNPDTCKYYVIILFFKQKGFASKVCLIYSSYVIAHFINIPVHTIINIFCYICIYEFQMKHFPITFKN